MGKVDLRSRIGLAEVLVRLIAERRDDVPIEFELRARPRVVGRPRALALALDNLLENARQASPPGGRVRVVLGADPRAAVVEVHDDGPGVPTELRERVFEPFFTTRDGAAGLGLTAARGIAHAHGGSVELGDGPGGIVRLRIPTAR